MDTLELIELCKRDNKISSSFLGVFPCDKLPRTLSWPSSLIANTQPSNDAGEHWVAIFINKEGYADYFCSYGVPPQFEFRDFLNLFSCSFRYSKKRIQSNLSTTCGQYSVFFLHARANGLPLHKFLDLFTKNVEENDEIVTMYINGVYDVDTKVVNF